AQGAGSRMSRSPHRVALAPGYVLHHRPWRDTSRILEVLTREHGRLTLFARAVRGPHARLAPLLQPFQPLLLSWSGRGEAPQLTGAERAEACAPLPPACLLGAFYLNELLRRLTTRHDPLPQLFDDDHATLVRLCGGAPLEGCLRLFEKRLLEMLGYGVELACEADGGEPLRAEGYYHFRAGHGLTTTLPGAARALAAGAGARGAERYAHARGRAATAAGSARRLPRGPAAGDARGGPGDGTKGGAMSAGGIALGVNIDHVATLRQVRRARYPDPVHAALTCESAGADNITLHLREDRRHIQDQDVRTLRGLLQTRMNLEMAVTDEMLGIGAEVRPQDCCLVPEPRAELTTEGGLDVGAQAVRI